MNFGVEFFWKNFTCKTDKVIEKKAGCEDGNWIVWLSVVVSCSFCY